MSVFAYQGNQISFQTGNGVLVNAMQMARAFNKQPAGWLRNSQSQEFIETLAELRNCSSADLVQVRRGGDVTQQGTWMHEDVAIEFARWLSPAFGIWCNDRIKELLTDGVAVVSNELLLHPKVHDFQAIHNTM